MPRQLKQHHAHILTAQERKDLIRFLLLPSKHKGELLIPNDEYFSTDGLERLANETIEWLGHKRIHLHVDATTQLKQGWRINTEPRGCTIYIDSEVVQHRPFLSAHYTICGVLATIVEKFSPMKLTRDNTQKVIEHMGIAGGLGIFAINAFYEVDIRHPFKKRTCVDTSAALTSQYSIQLFKQYCQANNISLFSVETYLLPDAKKGMQLRLGNQSYSGTIEAYLSHLRTKREKAQLLVLTSIFAALLIFAAWPYIPKPLTQAQRAMSQNIETLRGDYTRCNAEYRYMLTIPKQPDILSNRSIQSKAHDCRQLKEQHDNLVREFNRSL